MVFIMWMVWRSCCLSAAVDVVALAAVFKVAGADDGVSPMPFAWVVLAYGC